MNAREADDVTVAADERREGRAVVNVVHGNFTTSLRVSNGELHRLRDAIDRHLSDRRWEYVPGEIWVDRAGLTHVAVQSGTIAPDYVGTHIEEGGEVLRRRVGEWETVTALTETGDDS